MFSGEWMLVKKLSKNYLKLGYINAENSDTCNATAEPRTVTRVESEMFVRPWHLNGSRVTEIFLTQDSLSTRL